MTALVVINIKRELDKGQKSFSDKTVRILLAYLDAQEKRIAELEHYIDEHNKKVLAETNSEAQS